MTTTTKANARSDPHGRSRWIRSDEAMFRTYVDQLSFERRGEIDAVTRKLSRKHRAIAAVSAKITGDGFSAIAETQPVL